MRSQIEHGLDEAKYGYWGFSPANIPEGGYREYGVDAIGMQEDGYDSLGVVTPHASFLALPYDAPEALANLTALAQHLRPGLLRRPFRTAGFRSRVRPLLGKERFSI